MEPLRSKHSLLFVDGGGIARNEDGWTATVYTQDVNCIWTDEHNVTTGGLIANGPPLRMSADALDALARELGREPASLRWCVERRLLERIVDDDVEGVRVQLAALGSTERPTLIYADGSEPILTIALGAAAWKVALELIDRGEPLMARPGSVWDAADYAIATLDDSADATAVLRRLIERGLLEPSGRLLRQVRAPQIAHALIDAGADPNTLEPSVSTPDMPGLHDATPLAVAVVSRRLDVAAALFERGAAIDGRDADGCNPLLVAVLYGNEAPVRWLIDHGANLEPAPDAKGRTPRSLALARPDDPGSRVLLAALKV